MSAAKRQSARQVDSTSHNNPRSHLSDVIGLIISSQTLLGQNIRPSDKIIDIIHPTTGTSIHGKGTEQSKKTRIEWLTAFSRPRPSSSTCWAGAANEKVSSWFLAPGKISRTAGSIWGTTPPWLITTLPSNLFNLAQRLALERLSQNKTHSSSLRMASCK